MKLYDIDRQSIPFLVSVHICGESIVVVTSIFAKGIGGINLNIIQM